MFTYSCFIKDNNKRIIERLYDIGYDVSGVSENDECIATSFANEKAVGISYKSFYDINPHSTWNCAGRIDCGKNSTLFLAIAALRDDDIDYMQWFTDGNNWYIDEGHHNIMMKSLAKTIKNFHKATVEELIEHFT